MGNMFSRVINHIYADEIVVYDSELKKPNFVKCDNNPYDIYRKSSPSPSTKK
jgi:hypothetical protein